MKNRKELADRLNITVKTLSNWEKNKPELIKLINLGLTVEHIEGELQKVIEEINIVNSNTMEVKVRIIGKK